MLWPIIPIIASLIGSVEIFGLLPGRIETSRTRKVVSPFYLHDLIHAPKSTLWGQAAMSGLNPPFFTSPTSSCSAVNDRYEPEENCYWHGRRCR
jgi:hypothetical protein